MLRDTRSLWILALHFSTVGLFFVVLSHAFTTIDWQLARFIWGLLWQRRIHGGRIGLVYASRPVQRYIRQLSRATPRLFSSNDASTTCLLIPGWRRVGLDPPLHVSNVWNCGNHAAEQG